MFRWFLDMSLDEPVFDHSTFSQNSERVLTHEAAQNFFDAVVKYARGEGLLSNEHFTVDGRLNKAWASLKSVKLKDAPAPTAPPDDPGNPTVDFHGDRRTNATHQSTIDPDALLARKGTGKEAKLCFSGHVLMDNRQGLCVDLQIAPATGTAERDTALRMLRRQTGEGFGRAHWGRTDRSWRCLHDQRHVGYQNSCSLGTDRHE
ncbi:MAG: transposase [Nitrospira sp.]